MNNSNHEDHEYPLLGGNVSIGVVRVGGTVRRPRGASWYAIHEFLKYLETVEFSGAPRVLGIDDQGREILTFHPGETLWSRPDLLRSDDTLVRVARLVRTFHQVSSSFVLTPGASWSLSEADPSGGDLVIHNDLGPWNLVVGNRGWVLIDWDFASPGRVEWELAFVLHTFVPLWPDSGLSDEDLTRRIRLFADAYELDNNKLEASLSLVPARCLKVFDFIRQGVERQDPRFLAMKADGHDAGWATAAEYVHRRLPAWLAKLR